MLVESAGLPVEVEAPGVDERRIEGAVQGSPQDLARRLAAEKALAVSCRRPARIVVGADQVLALAGAIMHKPVDGAAARRQLHSAFTIAQDGAILRDDLDTARLTMRPLDDAAIGRYLDLAGEDVTRSVGGYRLESVGVHLFERIEGDHTTILGLPLLPLLAALRSLDLLVM
jgi:septum formation protein